MVWTIAFRNLIKNGRRSIMTMLAIAIGGFAALLFGGFVTSIWFGVQTSMIQDQGNLQVYRKGFLQFGAADPEAYTIVDWRRAAETIGAIETIRDDIVVITPKLDLGGIAGNVAASSNKTFFGTGVVAADIDRMRQWDGWRIDQPGLASGLSDNRGNGVVVGVGMARMLGICGPLEIAECTDPPRLTRGTVTGEADTVAPLVEGDGDLSALRSGGPADSLPRLNLLAATTTGLPNIARVVVETAQSQAQRAVDNAFVMMHFDQAGELLYGDSRQATALLIQIRSPDRAEFVKAEISKTLAAAGLDLEVYHFTEVDPTFSRIFGMFSFLFAVVSIVLAIVIVFTIVNTVSMSVIERVREIGTIRALGFRKGFVTRLFLAESALIGLFGAVLALIGAIAAATLINAMGVQWTPPSNAAPLTVQLMVLQNPALTLAVVAALAAVAVVAALVPTRRAARLNIVESLHHA